MMEVAEIKLFLKLTLAVMALAQ